MPDRYRLLLSGRRILWVAMAFAASGTLFGQPLWLRLISGLLLLATTVLKVRERVMWPCVVLDERGYAVEERGREKFRVAWSDVQRVSADAAEEALYVDCGDAAKNLLVPPGRGFGFTFERRGELFRRVIAAVPDRVLEVERLDKGTDGAHR
jgi:hypothetical protein